MSTTPIQLDAETRQGKGTRDSRRLRSAGKLPAVVYGHGEANQSVVLPTKQTVESLHKGAHLFELKLEGKAQQVLVKDVQYNHLGDEVLHLDLFRVDLNEEIHSEVAVHLVGDAKGVAAGGILTQMRDTIEIICKVSDLPDEIPVDVSKLGLGESLHVHEIQLPQGSKLPPHDADYTIVMVAKPRTSGDDTPETGAPNVDGSEPEIIGDKATADAAGEADTAKSANA